MTLAQIFENKGQEKAKYEMALFMVQKNLDLNLISKITNIPLEELESFAQHL